MRDRTKRQNEAGGSNLEPPASLFRTLVLPYFSYSAEGGLSGGGGLLQGDAAGAEEELHGLADLVVGRGRAGGEAHHQRAVGEPVLGFHLGRVEGGAAGLEA